MILKDEIDKKAQEFGINTTDVEKDYVFGWVLSSIYSQSPLRDNLILKGGNGLRKAYLPNTRFSKDLDFSIEQEIDDHFLKDELNKVCAYINAQTSIEFELDRTRVEQKDIPIPNNDTLEARLYFKGFYGEESISLKTQLDITQFDKIYLPIQERELIHPYSDQDACKTYIKSQKAEEILASKLNNLLHRQKVSDLFDLLYTILFTKDFSVNRPEVITTFLKRSIFESAPNSAKQQLLETQLGMYKPFWHTLIAPITSIFQFDVAVENFEGMINALFSLLPNPSVQPVYTTYQPSTGGRGSYPRYYPSPSYFGSDVRNTIISAGRSLTMVQMSYDGYDRLVEPYSMEYYVRKDGIGMEYFWGYDTSGGKSHRQSIKMFICDKITYASNTDYHFSPRYAVEF